MNQVIQRAQRFLDRCQRIRPVQPVHVDPVGLQPRKTGLHRLHDVAARASRRAPSRIGDANLVARITSLRRLPRIFPSSVSEPPLSPYESAVSKKSIPASSAAWITARVPASSSRPPKLLQPSPTSETCRPEGPSARVLIDAVPCLIRNAKRNSKDVLIRSRKRGPGKTCRFQPPSLVAIRSATECATRRFPAATCKEGSRSCPTPVQPETLPFACGSTATPRKPPTSMPAPSRIRTWTRYTTRRATTRPANRATC